VYLDTNFTIFRRCIKGNVQITESAGVIWIKIRRKFKPMGQRRSVRKIVMRVEIHDGGGSGSGPIIVCGKVGVEIKRRW